VFRKIRENRIYQEIADQILEAILGGELKPNDKLPSENELTGIFGVSRVTVREAIRSLEQIGVLEVRQGSQGGAYVQEIVMDDVAAQMGQILKMANLTFFHLAEARAVLEEIVLRKLKTERMNEPDFDELEKSIDEAESHFLNGRNYDRLVANFRFHAKISEMTGNPILILMHKIVLDLSMFFFEKVKPSDAMIRKTLQDHREVVDLLKKGDFERAGSVCGHHIQEVSARILEKSKEQSMLKKDRG
jgi:DNA-binding FadR family transcriptional regulator